MLGGLTVRERNMTSNAIALEYLNRTFPFAFWLVFGLIFFLVYGIIILKFLHSKYWKEVKRYAMRKNQAGIPE